MLHAQMRQRPPNLCRPLPVNRAAKLRRHEVVAAPIRIEAQRQAMRAKHLQQSLERRFRAFLRYQKPRVDHVRRVVHRHYQVQRLPPRQPFMARPILMKHHSRQRPSRPLAPVCAAPRGALQKPLRLQERLGPRVAPAETVAAHQVLVKVLRREPAVTHTIQPLDLLLPVDRNPLPRRPTKPPVQKTGRPALFVALLPTTECPLADPKQLRRFALVEFARFIPLQHAPELDHSHTLKGFRPAHPGSQKEPSSPDRSCAT